MSNNIEGEKNRKEYKLENKVKENQKRVNKIDEDFED